MHLLIFVCRHSSLSFACHSSAGYHHGRCVHTISKPWLLFFSLILTKMWERNVRAMSGTTGGVNFNFIKFSSATLHSLTLQGKWKPRFWQGDSSLQFSYAFITRFHNFVIFIYSAIYNIIINIFIRNLIIVFLIFHRISMCGFIFFAEFKAFMRNCKILVQKWVRLFHWQHLYAAAI